MSQQKTMTRDLTEGSITKIVLRYAAPLFVANALQAIYNVVDMMVVGQVEGSVAMAAVSTGGDLIHVLTFLLIGFTSAGQIIISQFVGAKQTDKVKKTIGTMFVLLFMIATVMGIIALTCNTWLLKAVAIQEEAFELSRTYLIVSACGIWFVCGYNTVCAILRGMGDSKHPFYFIAIASITNIVLDIVFVAGFHWSAFGAALATIIGQGLSFIIALIFLVKHKEEFGFDFKRESFYIDMEVLPQLVKLGIPMSIQTAAIQLSKLVLSRWINQIGVEYTALAGVYNKFGMFIGIISTSFTTAGSACVGQCIGAEKYERVPKIILTTGGLQLAISSVISILIYLFPDAVIRMFTQDQSVLAIGSLVIMPLILFIMGASPRVYGFSLINGSGNSKLNLLVALLDGIVSRIGLSYFFGFVCGMSCTGFWLGDACAGFVPLLVGGIFQLTGKWKTNKYVIRK